MELTKKITPQWVELKHEGSAPIGFCCAPLTSPQIISVRALMGVRESVGEGMMAAVRYSVRDWRGVTADGAPVDFSADALEHLFTGPTLALLLMELAGEIIERSKLNGAEVKN